MREILYRGKRVDNGEWVYGAYYKQEYVYGDKKEAHCIITTSDVLSNDLWLDYEEVIPETVGQFTGLTDKNGKKIFEGDILECKRIDDGITVRVLICIGKYVDYNSDDKNIGVYALLNDGATVGVNDIFEHQDMFEVIGNMHDNPELLEVEE